MMDSWCGPFFKTLMHSSSSMTLPLLIIIVWNHILGINCNQLPAALTKLFSTLHFYSLQLPDLIVHLMNFSSRPGIWTAFFFLSYKSLILLWVQLCALGSNRQVYQQVLDFQLGAHQWFLAGWMSWIKTQLAPAMCKVHILTHLILNYSTVECGVCVWGGRRQGILLVSACHAVMHEKTKVQKSCPS